MNRIFVIVCILLGYTSSAFALECAGNLSANGQFDKIQSVFSPLDRIHVKVDCVDLRPGRKVLHVNWIHNKQGIFRVDKNEIEVQGDRMYGGFFWFKLSRKGPIHSAISNSDYHEQNYGEWSVEVYLDDKMIIREGFEIIPGEI